MRPIVCAVLALLLCSVAVRGQDFEAASVKPVILDRQAEHRLLGGPGTTDPGQITYPQVSLWTLILTAYNVQPDQLSGPDWIRNEWYSVKAKLPPKSTAEDLRAMLQHLLAERFHLALHHDTREAAGYQLVAAAGGPKIKPAPADSGSVPDAPYRMKLDPEGFPNLPPGAPSMHMIVGNLVKSAHSETTGQLAADLPGLLAMSAGYNSTGSIAPRVVDKTGLTGKFEFKLEFAASTRMLGYLPPSPPGDLTGAPAASEPGGGGPNIFTALEKQLGLKLVKVAGVPVDVLVIDRADKVPTEN